MNRNDKWQNNKDYARAADITLSEEQRGAIGDMAIAHLAGGNADMFKLAISSLAKIDVQNEIKELKALICERVAKVQ